MNNMIIDTGLQDTNNLTGYDKKYNDAATKYKEMFGYEPLFISLPDPTIEQILNAVETGVELYLEESTQTEYEL
jgi:hypothetical protein